MTSAERERFDALLDQVIDSLPREVTDLFADAALVVEDRPSPELLAELGMSEQEFDELCGLHTGVPLTQRSVESHAELPDVIQIFRAGIIEHAGGWEPWQDDEGIWHGGEDAIAREIRITVLHEVGHHFGLDEDDLAELGYD